MAEKITYASLALTEQDHAAYEAALSRFQHSALTPQYSSWRKPPLLDFNPADPREPIATFRQATRSLVNDAVEAAMISSHAIKHLGWERRLGIFARARELVYQRRFDLAAILTLEAGKTRGEALAEVLEVISMIDAYEQFAREERFYRRELSSGMEPPFEQSVTSMEPIGPVAVIVPFNFPFALAANMSLAAFLAGNPLLFKPASDTPLATHAWRNILVEAGAPEEACTFLVGPGSTVGDALVRHPKVAGIAFTGSVDVGVEINLICARMAKRYGIAKRFIPEMGGKNAVIVTARADIAKAADGIIRAAVGYGGQKCSATSRVYAEEAIYDELFAALTDENRLKPITVGDPKERSTFVGPLINNAAHEKYMKLCVDVAHRNGRMLLLARSWPPESMRGRHGFFVPPFLITGIEHNDPLNKTEHFVPCVMLHRIANLDEGIAKANDTPFGLCAGIISEDEGEMRVFFDRIEAGVVYANRRGGATTGAWPTMQTFGGWKMSGLSGRSGFGPWYPTCFAREQCRTIVREPKQ